MDRGVSRTVARVLTVIAVFALSLGGAPPATRAQEATDADKKVGPEVSAALTSESRVQVMVELSTPSGNRAEAVDPATRRAEVARQRTAVLSAVTSADFQETVQFQLVPALAGFVTATGVQKLASHPGVARIDVDEGATTNLDESVPLVNADEQHARGNRGQGVVVAVLDTGIDRDHPDLSDGLIAEACFLNATQGAKCPNGTARQSGPNSAPDDTGHGTQVTGVIASNGVRAPVGMAPDAQYVAVKVLYRNPVTGRGTAASNADIVAALEYVYHERQDVRVINMSLGTRRTATQNYPAHCDRVDAITSAYASIINDLKWRPTNPALTIAASGNDSDPGAMNAPACAQGAVSVGSTTKQDQIAGTSNSSATLDLLAPGVNITTSSPDNTVATVSGTSFAAPHVAGCAALVLNENSRLISTELEARLVSSPVRIVDSRNGLSFPRLDCSPGAPPPPPPGPNFERPLVDFNGDGLADMAITRTGAGPNGQALWFSPDANFNVPFPNEPSDIPVPADYDGDGKTDVAFYRPSNGLWFGQLTGSPGTRRPWLLLGGAAGDVPIPCDYNGDGRDDVAYFRPSEGLWFGVDATDGRLLLSSLTTFGRFGAPGDIAVPADYDGDRACDVAIFRPTTGLWFGLKANGSAVVLNSAPFGRVGEAGDIAVPADYNGDGKADMGIYRPSNGLWFALTNTGTVALPSTRFGGTPGDIPVPSYYDSDARADLAVFNRNTGSWTVLQSTGNAIRQRTFSPGDYPLLKRPSNPRDAFPY